MTVVGVGMAIWRIEADRRAAKSNALMRIWRLGGDHETAGGETALIGLFGAKFGDEELALLVYFPETGRLDLHRVEATDDALVHLSAMRNLDSLYIEKCKFSGAGLKSLEHLPKLERLCIEDTPIDDRAIDHLLALKSLKSLSIVYSRLSEEGIARLKRCSTAQEVYVEGGYDEWMAELESSEQDGATDARVDE